MKQGKLILIKSLTNLRQERHKMYCCKTLLLSDSSNFFVAYCLVSVQFSSAQFSFISAPPHEQNNKMLRRLCVVKDGVRKRKKQQNELTL